jgi:hypothetical protein
MPPLNHDSDIKLNVNQTFRYQTNKIQNLTEQVLNLSDKVEFIGY